MENRLHLHHPGNTVIPPRPGRARIKINMPVADMRLSNGVQKKVTIPAEPSVQNTDPKVCVTSRCVWCNFAFNTYRIGCPHCGNCQYCGYLLNNEEECHFCGNHMAVEEMHPDNQIRLTGENNLSRDSWFFEY